MASGTITLTAYGKLPSYLNGRIVWSSVSNGTAANTSTVTAQLQISRNSSVATTGTWKGSLNVGGATKQISYYASVGSSWVTIDTFTATVTHNADGSGSCYIYGVLNGPTQTTLEGTYVSGSTTVTLDKITRYATISSATDFADTGSPTINYSNPAGTNVDSLQACISLDGSTAKIGYKDIPKTGTSYSFPLTESERNTLRAATPNSNTLKVYVLLKTVIGSASDVKSATATMSIVNSNPTISPSVVDTNSTTTNVTGNSAILVAGKSTAKVTINAAAKKYATITSRRVEHGTQVLTGDGTLSVTNNPIKITVTDSRGNSATHTAPNAIVPYFNPTCSIGNNMPETDGTFSLVVSGLFYNGSIGKKSNTLTVQYRRKTANGSYGNWTNISSVTKSGNSYTATANFTGLDYQTVYTFQARVIDVLNTGGVTSVEKAVISQPVFDWGKSDFKFNVPVQHSGEIIPILGTFATETALETSLNNLFNTMGNNEARAVRFVLSSIGDWTWVGTMFRSSNTYATLDVVSGLGSHVSRITKTFSNGAWTPLEWENPPMNLEVEYRTTERYNGNAIYTKAVSYGSLPNNTEKGVILLDTNLHVIDYKGFAEGTYHIPIPGYSGIATVGYTPSTGSVWVATNTNMSSYNAYFIFKYYK